MSDTRPLQLVTDPAELAPLAARLASEPRLAVDTEANSFHAYHERTCVVQISTPAEDLILDPLALGTLGPVGELLTEPAILKVVHGGDYDVVVLKRDFQLTIAPLFDTAVACQLLGLEPFGLAHLVERVCGVHLDKRFQRADWGRRPLSAEQIEYLRNDTRYLLTVADELAARIHAAQLGEEAELEFVRLTEREWTGQSFDADRWARIKGARELDAPGRGILRELFRLRDELAETQNRPPFKTIPDRVLLLLAQKRPRDGGALSRIRGIPSNLRRQASRGILAAIGAGIATSEEGPIELPRVRRGRPKARLSREAEARSKRLKDWRKGAAEASERTTLAVLPNPLLQTLAEHPPRNRQELEQVPGIGRARCEKYGEAILAVLSGQR